jgi:hypothetical protein
MPLSQDACTFDDTLSENGRERHTYTMHDQSFGSKQQEWLVCVSVSMSVFASASMSVSVCYVCVCVCVCVSECLSLHTIIHTMYIRLYIQEYTLCTLSVCLYIQ